jgi:hypothetical protein
MHRDTAPDMPAAGRAAALRGSRSRWFGLRDGSRRRFQSLRLRNRFRSVRFLRFRLLRLLLFCLGLLRLDLGRALLGQLKLVSRLQLLRPQGMDLTPAHASFLLAGFRHTRRRGLADAFAGRSDGMRADAHRRLARAMADAELPGALDLPLSLPFGVEG